MINEKELQNINDFESKHWKCYRKANKNSKFKIKAEATGLGYVITIKCCNCKKIEDITNYDSW